MRRLASSAVCLAITVVGFSMVDACAPLARRESPAAVAGEWVDVAKSTATDTMVWVLTPGGDDQLLHVSLDAAGITVTRRHFGRWSVGGTGQDGRRPTLCFVRRPGRDALSCVEFALDTLHIGARLVRRLGLFAYVGQHHVGDRVLLERLPVVVAASPTPHAADPTDGGSAGAGAFQPRAVQPERPSVATHAGTVAPGYVELETGFERDRADDGSITGAVPSVLKVGLTRRTQLTLQLPASGGAGMSAGLGDASIGVKWRFVEDDPRLQDLALLPQVKFSSGGARGTGTTDASLLLINSRTVGPIGVDLNLGVTRRSGDGTNAPRAATMWAVAAGLPVRGRLGWALETFGFPGTGGSAGGPPTVSLLTGPTLVVVPTLEIDAGAIVPLLGAPPRGLYAGLVSNLGRARGH